MGKDRHTVTNSVSPTQYKHQLRGLQRNSHYSVTVRALYTTGHWGPLSNQIYFATLPPVTVHVGRIGETFVHVRWERQPQLRVTNRLRTQHRQQHAEFEANQSQIQARVNFLQQQLLVSPGTPVAGKPKPQPAGAGAGRRLCPGVCCAHQFFVS